MTKDRRTLTPEEERMIIDSTERGEWRSVGDIDDRREILRAAAANKLDQINRELIAKAIAERRLLSLTYNSNDRTVAPYILGYDSRNQLLLSALQVAGGSGHGFRTFKVSDLSNIAITDQRFPGNDPDYNPRDPLFEQVIEKVAA